MSSASFCDFHGLAGSFRSSPSASTSVGTDLAGASTWNSAIAFCSVALNASAPGTRFHVVSRPSNSDVFAASPASGAKFSTLPSCSGAAPKPWLLCWLRLRAAISPYDSPSSGLKRLESHCTEPSGSFAMRSGDHAFQTTRFAFQTGHSGWNFGSAAALKASTASRADAV